MVDVIGASFALVAASSWSSRDILLKRGFLTLSPFFGVLANMLIVFPLLLTYGLVTGEWSQIPNLESWSVLFMVIGGVLQNLVGTSLFFASLKLIGASRAATFLPTQTLFAVTLAIIFLNETWTPSLLLGAMLVVIGSYTISRSMGQAKQVDRSTQTRGIVLAISAALVWGAGPIFFRPAMVSIGSASWGILLSSTANLVVGSIIFAGTGILRSFIRLKRRDLRLLGFSGGLDSLGTLALQAGLLFSPVVNLIPVISGRPFISILLSYIFIQQLEKVNWRVVLGSLLIVSGVYLVIFQAF
jgi:drug/metabolite transporter (DMT)-like permease